MLIPHADLAPPAQALLAALKVAIDTDPSLSETEKIDAPVGSLARALRGGDQVTILASCVVARQWLTDVTEPEERWNICQKIPAIARFDAALHALLPPNHG